MIRPGSAYAFTPGCSCPKPCPGCTTTLDHGHHFCITCDPAGGYLRTIPATAVNPVRDHVPARPVRWPWILPYLGAPK